MKICLTVTCTKYDDHIKIIDDKNEYFHYKLCLFLPCILCYRARYILACTKCSIKEAIENGRRLDISTRILGFTNITFYDAKGAFTLQRQQTGFICRTCNYLKIDKHLT